MHAYFLTFLHISSSFLNRSSAEPQHYDDPSTQMPSPAIPSLTVTPFDLPVPPPPTRKPTAYSCKFCDRVFTRKDNMKAHVRSQHGSPDIAKPNTCEVCSKTFSRSTHLKLHMKTHTGQGMFPCDVCHKSFKMLSCLKRHEKTQKHRNNSNTV